MSIVKSLSVGDGDMFYIRHGSDSFTMIDCCMGEWNREQIVAELQEQSAGKGIVRFISTHPDDDHIMGLSYLHQEMELVNFYCVKNEATKEEPTDDFEQYCALRDDAEKAYYLEKGCTRRWLNDPSEKRGSAGIIVLWPATSSKCYQEALKLAAEGESPNNISPIFTYSQEDGVTIMWMGDLETDFMESLDQIPVVAADVLFAPHHGRDSGRVPSEWLDVISPRLIIIGEAPSADLNYYAGYNTVTQNSAGDITLDCGGGNVHIYVSEADYSADFLKQQGMDDAYGSYIGTLKV
jgi:beta-lactamase superfamily II metal-dependent hydrolase